MKTIIYLSIIVAVAAVALGVTQQKLRKDLPYKFDFIKLQDGIVVNQHEIWNKHDLEIVVKKGSQVIGKTRLNAKSHTGIIKGLNDAEGRLTLVISRGDLVGRLRYRPMQVDIDFDGAKQKYILLAGASIGNNWKLGEFGQRRNVAGYLLSNRVEYEFDKSKIIDAVVGYEYKPDAVIIKECSAYFPRDPGESINAMGLWVDQLRKAAIEPILATTTPVADIDKYEEKQEAIDQWNDLVRDLGDKKKVAVLDLAKALRKGLFNTHLKDGYYLDDGYHLTGKAYAEAMDEVLYDYLAGDK